MVLTPSEQKYLLMLLKGEKIQRNYFFYRTMARLKDEELIEIRFDKNNRMKKIYNLTPYGIIRASLIAKDKNTDKKYKKYAKEIEMEIVD